MPPETAAPADERAAIRALWDSACRALCAGDWEAYRELWAPTEYVEVIHPQQADWQVGWEAIGAAYRALLASGFRCESETRLMRIHLAASGEMAWATAEVAIRTADPPQESTLWQTLVFEKLRGRWRLVHGHASVPGAPAPRSGGAP